MAPQFSFSIGMLLSVGVSTNQEWQCRSLSVEDGYGCATIECELTAGSHLGARVEMSIGDLLVALCNSSKDKEISEFALVDFKSDTHGMRKVALNQSVCNPTIPLSDYLGLIVAPDAEEEPGGLYARTIIDLEESKVTKILREIRTSKCFWERGL